MGIFAVWGQDSLYNGSGGMYECEVIEANSEQEAANYARTLSENIICSYQEIYDILEEQVEELCEEAEIEYGAETNEEVILRENIYDLDLNYGYVELDINKLPTFALDELSKMFEVLDNNFINEYQIE